MQDIIHQPKKGHFTLNALSIQPEQSDEKEGADSNARNRLITLAQFSLKQIRRLVILVVGTSVLLVGVVMVVTPGPALIVIPAGLGILAIEFAWARSLLVKAKSQIEKSLGGTDKQTEKNKNSPDH